MWLTQSKIGSTVLTGAGGTDGFLAKLTPSGVLVWSKVLGGAGNDAANALAEYHRAFKPAPAPAPPVRRLLFG